MYRILFLLLTSFVSFAQISSLPSGGSSYTAVTGVSIAGSSIGVDSAIVQLRSTEQAGTSTYCRSTTGNDTYTCSLTPTLTSYTTGSCLLLNPDTANTGAATLNVDALGAKSILGAFGSALGDGDIPAGPSLICYNGTAWIKQGDYKARLYAMTQGADIASAATIAPTDQVVRVSGTTAITTITVPAICAVASTACQITLIPTGLWTTGTAGNIALASTAVVSKALIMTWHNTAGKWYPSY